MQNAIFCYPDRTLSATLSGGSWSTALPLANLQNRLRSKVARTTSAANASTIIMLDLGVVKPVRMVALVNHNATRNATCTLSFSAVSASGSELGHPTGLQFWPDYYPAIHPLEWSESEFWNGSLTDTDVANYRPAPDLWYVLPQVVSARYVKIEIFDSANPAGYFELGRAFVANGYQPAINLDYDMGMGWKQDVDKSTTLGGVDWFNVKSHGREIVGTLGNMTVDEGMVYVFDRQRRLGQEGELYFILNPDDVLLLHKQRAMLCRHAEEDPLRFPSFDRTSGSFRLVEVR